MAVLHRVESTSPVTSGKAASNRCRLPGLPSIARGRYVARVAKRTVKYTIADVKRAVAGVRASGLEIARVDFEPDGTIRVVCGDGSNLEQPPHNPWDDA